MSAMQAFADPAKVLTPPEIWDGYDPTAEPLDEEVLKTWEEDGTVYKEVYFNGEELDGKYVRIYGIYSAPKGGSKLPAVLHIHGGGQTVNTRWSKEFAQRGYAFLTFNWGGEWTNRKRYTLWNNYPNGDHKKRHARKVTKPSPRTDAYYLWTQASRRALTYLCTQKEVDSERIGAFGVSMGGTIMWNLAFDDRIKAGCAIYGVGMSTYRYVDPRFAIGHPGHTPSENDLRWRQSMAPEASAPYVKFPMLYMSSTNDHHGNMDRSEQVFAMMSEGVPIARAQTPRYRHHIGADFTETLPQWMDYHLKGKGNWPANPKTSITKATNTVPMFSLIPNQMDQIEKVQIYYALENPFTVNRHWRDAVAVKKGETYRAELPVMNSDEYLFAFANITYKSGVVLSSKLEAVIPEKIGAKVSISKPNRTFYDGEEGLAGWVCSSPGTDPVPGLIKQPLKMVVGPDSKKGFTFDARRTPWTYAPGDPEFRAPKGASLEFEIKSTNGEDFVVKLHKNYQIGGSKTYAAAVKLSGKPGWQKVKLEASDFKEVKNGDILGESINEVNTLELAPGKGGRWQDKEIILRNFRWTGGSYVAHVHSYRNNENLKNVKAVSSDDANNLVDHEAFKSENKSQALIENAKFNSDNDYKLIQGGFKQGVKLWTDRSFVVKEFPQGLKGASYIMTPMVDRSNSEDELITFTMIEDGTVYVAVKQGQNDIAWLAAWKKSDKIVDATNKLLLYSKSFTKGTSVKLGSLKGSGIGAMYSVIITPRKVIEL